MKYTNYYITSLLFLSVFSMQGADKTLDVNRSAITNILQKASSWEDNHIRNIKKLRKQAKKKQQIFDLNYIDDGTNTPFTYILKSKQLSHTSKVIAMEQLNKMRYPIKDEAEANNYWQLAIDTIMNSKRKEIWDIDSQKYELLATINKMATKKNEKIKLSEEVERELDTLARYYKEDSLEVKLFECCYCLVCMAPWVMLATTIL